MTISSPAQAAVKCYDIGNGNLCAELVNDGYNATYYKVKGRTVTLEFTLHCKRGDYESEGAFQMSAGETRSYFFATGNLGPCHVTLHDVGSGATFDSPRVP
ncbi:hypothetical protein [Streptomyces sp. HUAS TT3]